jgi:UDP-3-O-[3-hydroxymyristoyl] glucosamine N-acyltransferase
MEKTRLKRGNSVKRTVADLEKLFGTGNCVIFGDAERSFSSVKQIQSASSEALTFCTKEGEEELRLLKETKAGIVLCKLSPKLGELRLDNKTLIAVKNPRLCFIRAINIFFPKTKTTGIHPTAIIGEKCRISKNVYIGPYVTICDGVSIGSGTRIYAGVHICSPTRIGKNVVLKSGCIIGGDGFGYERNEEGIFEKFPHLGGVVIEDDVEIGANTCVDRGTLSDTTIGKGTKIDNLVHIAHNVKIGKNCAVIALAMVGGGTQIDDGVWVAPTACLRNGIVIGKDALVGMGAVVTKNVERGETVIGVPAKPIKPKGKE